MPRRGPDGGGEDGSLNGFSDWCESRETSGSLLHCIKT